MNNLLIERVRNRPWQQGLDDEKELGQKWEARREYYAEAVKCKLRCVVRVRPAEARAKTCVSCEERIGPWVSVNGGPNLEFTTAVLGPASSQRDVYTECAEPLLEAALGGQDSCLFAYGQTGAGKTHSMLGAEGGHCASKLDGVVPQLCAELFRTFSSQTKKGELEYQIQATYVEIYKHRVYDLLAPELPGTRPVGQLGGGHCLPELTLKETWDGEWLVAGATCERVYSSAGLTALIERATSRRTTSSNSVHEHSSRSHARLMHTLLGIGWG